MTSETGRGALSCRAGAGRGGARSVPCHVGSGELRPWRCRTTFPRGRNPESSSTRASPTSRKRRFGSFSRHRATSRRR